MSFNCDRILCEGCSTPCASFFWDIEVFSSRRGRFPWSALPGDRITMISVVAHRACVLTTLDVRRVHCPGVVVIVLANEHELLLEYIAMYESIKPACHVHFNGTSFDIPYMKARMRYNEIAIPDWLSGGVDIYRWYRKNRPGWKSYTLESIANLRLGKGKVPMAIREMFAIMRTNIGTDRLVKYSITDTLLLVELAEIDSII